MKAQDMTQRYRNFKRSWGMWYTFDTVTGNSVSLRTRIKTGAEDCKGCGGGVRGMGEIKNPFPKVFKYYETID